MNRKVAGILILTSFLVIFSLFYSLGRSRFEQNYFFMGENDEEDFNISFPRSRWNPFIWHGSENDSLKANSRVMIENGVLDLFNNETTGRDWGSSIVIQGRFPHDDRRLRARQLLVGPEKSRAEDKEYCEFQRVRSIPQRSFWLEVRLRFERRVVEREEVDVLRAESPSGDVGIDLIFAINDLDYDGTPYGQRCCVHFDIIFAGFRFNGSWIEISEGTVRIFEDGGYGDGDIHVSYYVYRWRMDGRWQTVQVDIGRLINELFANLSKYDVEKLRLYGWQLYVDGIGLSVNVQFDYMRTVLSQRIILFNKTKERFYTDLFLLVIKRLDDIAESSHLDKVMFKPCFPYSLF